MYGQSFECNINIASLSLVHNIDANSAVNFNMCSLVNFIKFACSEELLKSIYLHDV